MNFAHTEDRRMLADTLNRFVSEQYGIEHRNQLAYGDEGHSPALYAQFAELGAIGALFPESEGGFGGAGFDISVVFEALGRGLVAEPLLGALLVGQALIAAGTQAQKAKLEDIVAGGLIATLAHEEPGSHYELSNVAATAAKSATGWTLNGAKAVVAFGEKADLLLVSARTAGGQFDTAGISLFLVDGNAAGIAKRGYSRFEGGRAAELTFTNVQLDADALLGAEGQGHAVLERIQGYALLALAAEALGAMDVAKQSTLEYLQTRKQFGVAIGTFQALQHRMADLLLEVEQMRSAVINAADAIDNAEGVAREKVLAAAKYTAGYVGALVAEESIQMHGGIGMTWELPLAHYAKRLVLLDHQFGDEDHHLERFMALSQQA
ncbi:MULTISPECIES: acyl-CoA dehydrogenase family protein [Comamonas]|jgi:alkylation response protein AidB-like acyl-CoA dehydrogenase|uniref:Pimeloyl-CoA dehydrogenase small subunit n=1 Tax=Comamonas terrigena TaxID=32013 RepID=A0A2A7UZQ8_COMTR|nr:MULTISPECIES: acyl-CoA dehydrogenase family protein [Comamonas]MBD9533441.1 acyl-CoA dehydrogenase family protein [Comamonas sp. CMM01]MDH0049265.1 acyl-CoA dehydrogenase family protein [Comamonas terrigena]MDH0510929.1 acyl-CoA dehydrogenase family protein [Comamonas terrigena]MDH1090531.1 acyl-CoA dehydrogenase family protein [Comamonas terrigena]MDH1500043.1 acyl-CoA dehydrogenase family protein [Comamonas terrigena]